MDFDATEQVNALARMPPEPPKPPERGLWRTALDSLRGAGDKAMASALEVGRVIGPALVLAGDATNDQALGQVKQPPDFGENDLSKPWRDAERRLRPDPATAGKAEQIVYGAVGPLASLVGSALLGGPAGLAAAAGEQGFSQAEDLRQQGVDPLTRTAVGAVTAAVTAGSAMLPLMGSTVPRTLGLYLAGGPGGFMAQQQATRSILAAADYGKIAQQFDPLDPVGLAVSALIPLPFTGVGLARNLRAGAKAPRAAESGAPAGDRPGGDTEMAPAPSAPPEAVDAAMVHNLTLKRDASESRLGGVASQIGRGVTDAARGVTESVIAAAARVREFMAGPARDTLDNRTKINVANVSEDAAARIEAETGVDVVAGARHEVRADAARHAQNSHPELTADDWSVLPWLAENFDRAVLLKPQRGDQGPRVALAAIDPATGMAYVAEYRTGKNKGGPRLSLVTFFRDHPNAVESYLSTNGRPRDGGQGGGGTPDAPVLPTGPRALTSETGSGGSAIVSPDIGRLAAPLDQARRQLDDLKASGVGLADFLAAGRVPPEVNNLMIGLRAVGDDARRMKALVQELAGQAKDATKSAADATADAVETTRALTEQQLAGLEAPPPARQPETTQQAVQERVAAVEEATPDLPVAEGEAAAEFMARARREAQEGTEFELGARDADLVRVAAECALATGSA